MSLPTQVGEAFTNLAIEIRDTCIDPALTKDYQLSQIIGQFFPIDDGVDVTLSACGEVHTTIEYIGGAERGTQIGALAVLKAGSDFGANVTIGERAEVGPQTYIEMGSVVGADTKVGAETEIEAGVILGNRVAVGDNVKIASGTKIGSRSTINDGVLVGNNASLGENVTVGKKAVIEETEVSVAKKVTIENDVNLHAGVTIEKDADIQSDSVVWHDAKVGRGVTIGEGVTIEIQAQLDPKTTVGPRALIGAKAKVGSNVTVGSDANVGSQAVIRAKTLIPDRAIIADGSLIPDSKSVLTLSTCGENQRTITVTGSFEGPRLSAGCQVGKLLTEYVFDDGEIYTGHAMLGSRNHYAQLAPVIGAMGQVVQANFKRATSKMNQQRRAKCRLS